jgi:type IV secretion system protein VirB6
MDWMDSSFSGITAFISRCIEPPEFTSMQGSSTTVELNNNKWIPTGAYVNKDKLLQIEWSSRGILPRPSKYKVLYRIDPRFEEPQVFIQKYNYNTNLYDSDFHKYRGGILLNYQDVPEMTLSSRITDFVDFFSFNEREKISVKKDDVINITLDDSGAYFGIDSEMNNELGSLDDLLVVYTHAALNANRIIYTNANQFCIDAIKPTSAEYSSRCPSYGLYWDVGYNWQTFQGRISSLDFDSNKTNINRCADSANGKDNSPLCYYDKGRGFQIDLGGTTIKETTEKFVNSPFTGKDFFYHKAQADGDLMFKTPWLIDGMYNDYSQLMKNWSSFADYNQLTSHFNSIKSELTMNFLHFGRYLMYVEVGSSEEIASKDDIDSIKVEYIIKESGVPDDSTSGTAVDRYYRSNADETGFLFVRAIDANDNLAGTIHVKTTNYTGSTWFSDLIYGKLIGPLREKINELSQVIYQKLVSNATLQGIGRTMLVLYIIVYGLLFLAGATQISAQDIITRVVKITLIIILFSETSWTFFSQNLFNIFTEGIDSLLTSVVGVTSREGNVFGFIDPIFDKYSNGNIWGLLFIQLLQIHTGLTFFAILTIYAMLLFFRAVIEVIVSYCLAFVGLAVMISLAPFFIVLILFEKTRGMFDNWISLMFSYMITPTILLIFFLLIDQIMNDHILRTITTACWGELIPIKIALDLNHIGISWSFSFELPFFPGVFFYIPEVSSPENITDFFFKKGGLIIMFTSSLIFFSLAKLSAGLVDYTSLIVSILTNVQPARQNGELQNAKNPVKDITSDVKNLASSATKTASNAAFKAAGNVRAAASRSAGNVGSAVSSARERFTNRKTPNHQAKVSGINNNSSAQNSAGKTNNAQMNDKFSSSPAAGKNASSGVKSGGVKDNSAVSNNGNRPGASNFKEKLDTLKRQVLGADQENNNQNLQSDNADGSKERNNITEKGINNPTSEQQEKQNAVEERNNPDTENKNYTQGEEKGSQPTRDKAEEDQPRDKQDATEERNNLDTEDRNPTKGEKEGGQPTRDKEEEQPQDNQDVTEERNNLDTEDRNPTKGEKEGGQHTRDKQPKNEGESSKKTKKDNYTKRK